jgi:hypothetical protein
MSKVDVNRLLTLMALIAIVVFAAASNYRLEIGALGLKFERNSIVTVMTAPDKNSQ